MGGDNKVDLWVCLWWWGRGRGSFVRSTKTRVAWEEDTSVEELSPSDWPVTYVRYLNVKQECNSIKREISIEDD